MTDNILYLHGFASSPKSTKALMFGEAFADYDIHYVVPDLNVPDFAHLTLTAILERIAKTIQALPGGPVYVIGSSFGGLATVHFLDRYPEEAARVEKALLLAPALDFVGNRSHQFGDDVIDKWRDAGTMPFLNYAENREIPVHFGLVEDAQQYDSMATQSTIPMQIYHGLHDESVPYQGSVMFADARPNVALNLVDSDHSLQDQMPVLINTAIQFFDLTST